MALLSDDSQEGSGDGISGVSLVGVGLDHNPLVHLGLVVHLVFLGVVGVHSMGHVGGDDEGLLDGFFEVVAGLGILTQEFVDAGEGLEDDVGAGALARLGATLLVVEEGSHVDEASLVLVLHEGEDGVERAKEIVEAGRGDEFVVKPEEPGGVGIGEVQIVVDDVFAVDPRFRGDLLEEWGMMPNLLLCLFVLLLIFLLIFLGILLGT